MKRQAVISYKNTMKPVLSGPNISAHPALRGHRPAPTSVLNFSSHIYWNIFVTQKLY